MMQNAAKIEQAALALAGGERPGAIALRLGVDRKTLWKWQQSPKFAKIYDDFLSQQRQEIIGKMRSAGGKAIDLLLMAIEDDAAPLRCRLSAAIYVLDKLGAGDLANLVPPTPSADDCEKMSDEELKKILGIKPEKSPRKAKSFIDL